jgi:hypothetical protein
MKNFKDIKRDINLINSIDWDILPEEAVGRHLEWGAGWAARNFHVSTSQGETIHFTINTWDDPPVIHLIKRSGFDTEIIATINIPEKLRKRFLKTIGNNKGIYAPEGEIKRWLKSELEEQ